MMVFRRHKKFRLGGRTYYVRHAGRVALQMIRSALELQKRNQSLLSLRPQIRRVLQCTPSALLCFILRHSQQVTKVRLAIWILSKNRMYVSIPYIFAHYDHMSPKVRRDVVRALHRLNAWQKLQRIGEITDDEALRNSVAENARPAFSDRLSLFTQNVTTREFASAQADLFVAEGVSVDETIPPRDHWSIRGFLRKVRVMNWLSDYRSNRTLFGWRNTRRRSAGE